MDEAAPLRLPPSVVVAVALVIAAVTNATVLLSDLHGGREGQLGLDTAAATIGVLLAYLLFGRFRASRSARDLLLCEFLLLLGASNAVFSAIPRSFGSAADPGASAAAGVVAGLLFVAATWLPARWHWRWSSRWAAVALIATAVAVLAVCHVASPLRSDDAAASVDTFGAASDLLSNMTQVVTAGLFALGGYGAARTAGGDGLLRWLTAAAVFGAASRLDFAKSSDIGDAWSTAGTFLRLIFYVVLVAAAGAEIGGYWRRIAEVAVLEERRRMARDMHDGLAQELAFAATQARALADASEHPTRARLVAAATERALDESRRAIAALTRPLDEPLEVTVAQAAEEVCGRFDIGLALDVQAGLTASPETREALLRILREAVSNAARHSAASEVRVRLRGGDALSLRVEDDGRGFDPEDLSRLSGRFGLVSMRERTQAAGGTFTLVSRLQGGTSVEVTLPDTPVQLPEPTRGHRPAAYGQPSAKKG